MNNRREEINAAYMRKIEYNAGKMVEADASNRVIDLFLAIHAGRVKVNARNVGEWYRDRTAGARPYIMASSFYCDDQRPSMYVFQSGFICYASGKKGNWYAMVAELLPAHERTPAHVVRVVSEAFGTWEAYLERAKAERNGFAARTDAARLPIQELTEEPTAATMPDAYTQTQRPAELRTVDDYEERIKRLFSWERTKFLPAWKMEQTTRAGVFVDYLRQALGDERAEAMCERYAVGTFDVKRGAVAGTWTAFPYIDVGLNAHARKMFKYRLNAEGKTTKKGADGVTHARWDDGSARPDTPAERPAWRPVFGEHLLSECQGATIFLHEAEDTAVLLAGMTPDGSGAVHMAAGGREMMERALCRLHFLALNLPEAFERVVIVPDEDASVERVVSQLQQAHHIGKCCERLDGRQRLEPFVQWPHDVAKALQVECGPKDDLGDVYHRARMRAAAG